MASMLHSGCSIFLFAFAFAGSTNAALSVDETLDAGAAAFYAPAPTHGDRNNASIGLMGLGNNRGQTTDNSQITSIREHCRPKVLRTPHQC